MSFSNRCFPTKAVSIWTATGDLDHIWIVGAYYHFATGFERRKVSTSHQTPEIGSNVRSDSGESAFKISCSLYID